MSVYLVAHDAEHGNAPPMLVQFSIVVGAWSCRVPVLPNGDGADSAPLEQRTAKCRHRTTLFIGQVPTCLHHIRQVLPMLALTEIALCDGLRRSGQSQPVECP